MKHFELCSSKLSKAVVVAISTALISIAWLTSPSVSASELLNPPVLMPTPTPQFLPVGIEIPLGRYAEPANPIEAESRAPSAPSILTEAKAPALGTNFDGIGQELANGFIFSPPDTHAATGPDRIVEVTNGHIGIYSKTGTIIAGGDTGGSAVSLNDFCNISSGCFDPKVMYDQWSGRFVIVVLEGKSFATSSLHIMVSKTNSPGNLTTDWDKFVDSASATIDGTNAWFDYPGLGVSPDAVVVTGNMFDDGGTFAGTKIRIFDKVELYDEDATVNFVDIDRTLAQGGFTVQPAHHLSSPPAGTFYLFQRVDRTNLAVTTLTGIPATPIISNLTLVTTMDQGFCVSQAPQMGTTKVIDTVCPRMMNAVWWNNSLWGTLTGSDASDTRSVVQWFEYDTEIGGASLKQQGAIDGGSGEFTFMPSISVDACGNVALTYSQSSSNRFPEMRYSGRAIDDPLNTMQTPVVVKASAFFFDDFTGLPSFGSSERWGDYSSTVVDPADQSFWIVNQYAKVAASGSGNDGRWGTWHANFTFDCNSTTIKLYLPLILK